MNKLLLLTCAGGLAAYAGATLSDDFESYTAANGSFTTVAAGSSLGLWNLTVGSIDLLNNYPGLLCHSGTKCVDMDGSTNAAGTMSQSFIGTAGTQYTLTFWYAGNQRGGAPDSMSVSLGSSVLNLNNIVSTTPFSRGTLTFTPLTTGSVKLQFAHTGGDNIGILLDDVLVNTPEPATWVLMAAGLVVTGLLRRQAA